MNLRFEVTAKQGFARSGTLVLNDQTIETPEFMPVGTRGSIKAIDSWEIDDLDYQLILANTYHLYLKPGIDVLRDFGGLKNFMGYSRAILTDSGGYQMFSLGSLFQIHRDGVKFQSHIDGSYHEFTPSKVIDIQRVIGSDIMMVLDDCAPYGSELKRLEMGCDTTRRWALDSIRYWEELDRPANLFCIVQGGTNPELRKQSLEDLQAMSFPGVALGGLSVGEPREEFRNTLAALAPELDSSRPHYLMGVGTVPDILDGVRYGVDLFDCVLPTRNARNGQVFTSKGKLNLRNEKFKRSDAPIDTECGCRVCQRYSLGYLRHLHNVGEITAYTLSTFHNLAFMKKFLKNLRDSIKKGDFEVFSEEWKKLYP